VLALLGVVLVVSLFLAWKPARSVTLLAPAMVGFVQAGSDIWVERSTNAEQRESILHAVAAAHERLRAFFGHQVGQPVVLACSTPGCFRRCGGIGHGTTYFGNRVLLGPAALNVTKVIHEFTHVELAARVGAVRALLRVPQWFDEGLAVMVSDDPAFDEAKWMAATAAGTTAPDLARLVALRDWLNVTKVDGLLSYGTARHEVAGWYERVGLRGVEHLFAMLRDGSHFQAAYTAVLDTGQGTR
jgi:hypothetical protein